MKIADFKLGRSLWACLPLAVMSLAGSAYANITPVLTSNNACTAGTGAGSCNSLDGGSYTGVGFAWVYDIQLDANQTIDPTNTTLGNSGSSYGAIYDFGPILGSIVDTGTLASSFTVSTALTTTAPTGISPTDKAALLNVVYVAKVGTNINGSPTGKDLGTITIISAYGGSTNRQVNFVGQAISNATQLSTGNLGSVEAPNSTPEPATLSLLFAGLVGAFVYRRKRITQN